MPNTWVSDQVNTILVGSVGGLAAAGIAGGPTLPRATEYRGLLRVQRFTFSQAAPNPAPGFPVGTVATGDTLLLTFMDPIQRIILGQMFYNAWGGTAPTVSVGKLDTNNAANTDPTHYLGATNITALGNNFFTGATGTPTNMTEQVGADPLGDQTTRNLLPQFGSGKVWLTGTLGGTLGANGLLWGYVILTEEGN